MKRPRQLWRSEAARWVMLATIALLLAMDLYQVSLVPGEVNADRIGTLGEWFAAVATVGTIAIAASALRGDRRAEAQREQAARLEAAGAVYSWLERRQLRPGQTDLVLVAVNQTSVPIYTWRVAIEGHTEEPTSELHGPLLPGRQEIVLRAATSTLGKSSTAGVPRVGLYFKSWLGSELHRMFDGSLEEVGQQ